MRSMVPRLRAPDNPAKLIEGSMYGFRGFLAVYAAIGFLFVMFHASEVNVRDSVAKETDILPGQNSRSKLTHLLRETLSAPKDSRVIPDNVATLTPTRCRMRNQLMVAVALVFTLAFVSSSRSQEKAPAGKSM